MRWVPFVIYLLFHFSGSWDISGKKSITVQATTLHRHLEAEHYNTYHKWAKKVGFTSALPKDRRAQKQKEAVEALQSQLTLDGHLKEMSPKEKIIPYSHEAFQQAAIEWLVATDQPIDALEHEKFQEMIDIASHAKDGVCIPGRKSTHEEIIDLFKRCMEQLKANSMYVFLR
ncbi:hypothetical protein B0H10DRAFT_1822219 [Mycena sp. CBHHK59/15]|nr:hypothetical protein B0H10DRAFT_1822219 [Mycena sp. CBHHK59/15]